MVMLKSVVQKSVSDSMDGNGMCCAVLLPMLLIIRWTLVKLINYKVYYVFNGNS